MSIGQKGQKDNFNSVSSAGLTISKTQFHATPNPATIKATGKSFNEGGKYSGGKPDDDFTRKALEELEKRQKDGNGTLGRDNKNNNYHYNNKP